MAKKGTVRPDVAFSELAANRKSKKAQKAANQTTNNQIEEGNDTMELANHDVEVVPSTIVEGLEAEVFAGQETQTETEVSVAQAPEQTTQPEQAAPKPPRVSKRPYINDVASLLEAGTHDAKEIVKLVLEKYSEVKKGGIQTFVTDLKNAKYRHWKDRAVVVNPAGKLQFEDKVVPVEVPAAEVVTPTEGFQPEQPAE
jgi:hypothetical protein